MIVKNEIVNLPKLLDVVVPILPEINIVDTGSTDGTLELLQATAAKNPNLRVHQFTWIDDFSAARNFSFSKAQQPFVLWLDGDDLVDAQELRTFMETQLNRTDVDAWIMDYHYAFLPDGSPSITLGRERVIRRSCTPTWVGAIHETVSIWNMRTFNYDGMKVRHFKHLKAVDHGRNLRILAKEFEKNNRDARTAYYYGKELFDSINPKGIEILEYYLTLPGRWFDDEVNARFRLGRHYLSVGKHTETVQQAEAIYHLDSTRGRAEAYFLWGMVEKALNNPRVAIEWFERCVRELPPSPRVVGTEYYTWNPCWRAAECHLLLNDHKSAYKWAKKAQSYLKDDQNLSNFISTINYSELDQKPEDFGPHRLRITNLIKSLEKSGKSVKLTLSGFIVDNIYVTQLRPQDKLAKTVVLDLCEDVNLPYSQFADIVMTSSPILAERVRREYNKPAWVLDDHFEWGV